MTARYRWLREIWGSRVTIRSWLAGWLVLLLALGPHLAIWVLLLFLMPDVPNWQGAVMFGMAVLAVAFFAFGGGIWLLRRLKVVRAARVEVREVVSQLAQQMQVPGPVRVFELEWAQVNAVAWQRYGAVGFSKALLDLMTLDEVRAVAAHELAHLLEPRWVRRVRTAQMFVLLPLVPLAKYGGTAGWLGGLALLIVVLAAYKRFTRRFEVRADRIESETVAESDAYKRSMLKLHEANLTPAVMPGAQTHPHLYDRLLAAGFQPDFKRPAAPSRAKAVLAAAGTGLAAVVAMFLALVLVGVVQRLSAPACADPTARLPARFKLEKEIAVPDFSEAAKHGDFQEAVQEICALFGAQPQALKSEAEEEVVRGGVSFEVPEKRLEATLFQAHTNLLARGYYLFRFDHNFGINGQPDKVGLLPMRDKYAVMAAIRTNGDNYRIGTAGVIAWMQELEQEQPFVLTGIGFDFLEGRFTSPVKNPLALARRMYEFCPDIVDQGTENVPRLARELEKGRLYFWWD